jgi:glycine/D-amino acid oxidase-like deaminating enzyme
MNDYDVAVVGGGLLGSAFAFGLSAMRLRVALFDEGDDAIRTARGNFGLVWVQGKGQGMREYARWTLHSSRLWSSFAQRLADETGTDVGFHRPGGFYVAIDHHEHARNLALLQQLRDEAGEESYAFEVLEHAALAKTLPGIGADVPGGTYCPHDGHANPLKLLRALHHGFQQNGGAYLPRRRVTQITAAAGGGFSLVAANHEPQVQAEKVVVAAGHGSLALAPQLDLQVPVFPVQGQIVVTEKASARLRYPTNYVRQTDEGNYLLGPSERNVGFDLNTESGTLRDIARQCSRAFPHLRELRVQRAWAGARIGRLHLDTARCHSGGVRLLQCQKVRCTDARIRSANRCVSTSRDAK